MPVKAGVQDGLLAKSIDHEYPGYGFSSRGQLCIVAAESSQVAEGVDIFLVIIVQLC